jgi:hypothetical protein
MKLIAPVLFAAAMAHRAKRSEDECWSVDDDGNEVQDCDLLHDYGDPDFVPEDFMAYDAQDASCDLLHAVQHGKRNGNRFETMNNFLKRHGSDDYMNSKCDAGHLLGCCNSDNADRFWLKECRECFSINVVADFKNDNFALQGMEADASAAEKAAMDLFDLHVESTFSKHQKRRLNSCLKGVLSQDFGNFGSGCLPHMVKKAQGQN